MAIHLIIGAMAGDGNKDLNIYSYNCIHADNVRLPFLRELYESCDFLLVQEHALFKNKLSWFGALGPDVGIHGVSAMDDSKPLNGRPFGGAAVLWHESLDGRIIPVPWQSDCMCAVKYINGNNVCLLIICVYMPCDDWRHDGNVIEYCNILNEISILISSVDADCLYWW